MTPSIMLYTGAVGTWNPFWGLLKSVLAHSPETPLCLVPNIQTKRALQTWVNRHFPHSSVTIHAVFQATDFPQSAMVASQDQMAKRISQYPRAVEQVQRDILTYFSIPQVKIAPGMSALLDTLVKQGRPTMNHVNISTERSCFWIGFLSIPEFAKPWVEAHLQKGSAHSFLLPWESQHPAYALSELTREWLLSRPFSIREVVKSEARVWPRVDAYRYCNPAQEAYFTALQIEDYLKKSEEKKPSIVVYLPPQSDLEIHIKFHFKRLKINTVQILDLNTTLGDPVDAIWSLGLGSPPPHPLLLSPQTPYLPQGDFFRHRAIRLLSAYQAQSQLTLSTTSLTPPHELSLLSQLWSIPISLTPISLENPPLSLPQSKGLTHSETQTHWQNRLQNHTFSASQLETYQKCPQKYFFQYVLKLEPNPLSLDQVHPSEWGSQLHAMMCRWMQTIMQTPGPHTPEQLTDWLSNSLDETLKSRADLFLEWQVKANVLQAQIFPHLIQNQIETPMAPIFLEKELIFTLQNKEGEALACKGRLDALISFGGTPILVDYKTGKTLPTKADMVHFRSLQLPFYHLALQHHAISALGSMVYQIALPDRVSQTIAALTPEGIEKIKTGRKRPHILDPKFLEQYIAHLFGLYSEIKKGVFSPEFTPMSDHMKAARVLGCQSCEFRTGCMYREKKNGMSKGPE